MDVLQSPLLSTPAREIVRSSCRHLHSLLWAEARDTGPFPKAKGHSIPQREGLRYERRLCRYLAGAGELLAGQWIEYEDRSGTGWAQMDALLIFPDRTLVFEAKRTWTPDAQEKLHYLYGPLVRAVWQRPTRLIQVCKHLRPGVGSNVVFSLDEVVRVPTPGHQGDYLVWCWDGREGRA